MNVPAKPLAEITREALAVLNNTIGASNTVRFLTQFTTGFGDYTEERKRLFADMTLDDIKAGINKMRDAESREQTIRHDGKE